MNESKDLFPKPKRSSGREMKNWSTAQVYQKIQEFCSLIFFEDMQRKSTYENLFSWGLLIFLGIAWGSSYDVIPANRFI